ncbi:MAG: hypothetical protein IJ921_06400 [Paludibacteraceae bacterium]|nr:hypothetical protein [Paludibacteraceae bacterium]
MKKVFSLISVFALAMGAMAETQSATLTVTESTTVTDGKISQNGIIVSGVAKVYKNEHVGCMFINPEVTEFDYDLDGILDDFAGELEVSLEGGYNITKIVITPQDAQAEDNASWIVNESSVTWTRDGNNAVWEGNAKSVPFGDAFDGYAVKDIIVYYDDATATAAVEAQADKQKAVKSVNRFGEVTIEADGVKFGINGVKK